jgi:hypothetical protein
MIRGFYPGSRRGWRGEPRSIRGPSGALPGDLLAPLPPPAVATAAWPRLRAAVARNACSSLGTVRPVLVVLACAAVLAACGGGDGRAVRPASKVQLSLTGPGDAVTVKVASVTVSGRVRPARAQVVVGGRPAAVSGGTFSVDVPLDEGANVIDVTAGVRGFEPTLTAVRVERRTVVTLPDLLGLDAGEAEKRLEQLELTSQRDEQGGLFDSLLPGDPGVCATRPDAGAELRPGSTVTLEVARRCAGG